MHQVNTSTPASGPEGRTRLSGLSEAFSSSIGAVGMDSQHTNSAGDRGVAGKWLSLFICRWKPQLQFLLITLQLAILVWVCRRFKLEHEAFSGAFLLLTGTGFVVHHCLPRSWRLNFFVNLSLAAYVIVLGWRDALSLILIILLFVQIARSAVALPVRLVLLSSALAGVIYVRGSGLLVPWSTAIWPIFWSMMLFRLIIYMFDLRHGRVPTDWKHAMAYFFLLPNVVFPLFPPIDYSALWRNYYRGTPCRIYQQGIHWMLTGVVHLLVYRYIDYNWIKPPEQIMSSRGLIQYVIANYLLIIRLSGQFHMIVGILHLFGFALPRCMDYYFLATGFTDYWRRVNIYWKDFLQKTVYYPVFFGMRNVGNTMKLVIATVTGFLATWVFHSAQWFGLRGTWMISSTDIFFWSSLAVLVLGNSLYEARYGRERSLVRKRAGLVQICLSGLRATGVFIVMALLWSVWISPGFANWWNLVSRCNVSIPDIAVVLTGLAVSLCFCAFLRDRWLGTSWSEPKNFTSAVLWTGIPIVVLALSGSSRVSALWGAPIERFLADMRTVRLNEKHDAMQFQGYYEQLNDVNDFNFRLYQVYSQQSSRVGKEVKFERPQQGKLKPYQEEDEILGFRLKPSVNVLWNGYPFRTNRWGMRDKDYSLEPHPGTKRIALMGGSVSLAMRNPVEDGYETLIENQLNLEKTGPWCERYEILNFSVGGMGILQRLILLDKKALDFKPDVVLFTSHLEDSRPDIRHLSRTPLDKIPYPEVVEIVRAAGVTEETPEEEIKARLLPVWEKLLQVYYRRAVTLCHQRGVKIALVLIPSRPEEQAPDRVAAILDLGKEVGFDALIDLSRVYDGYAPMDVQVSSNNYHPNAQGHRLIYQRLYSDLVNSSGAALGLVDPNGPASVNETSESHP